MQDSLVSKLRRAAGQRLTAAQYLLTNEDLWLEAIYIAGYAVEIALKAIILNHTPARHRMIVFKGFRGAGWHDLLRLKKELEKRNCRLPIELTRHFARIATWTTDLRYEVGRKKYREADVFIESACAIYGWMQESI